MRDSLAICGVLLLLTATPVVAKTVSFTAVLEGDSSTARAAPPEIELHLQGEESERFLQLAGKASAEIDLPVDTDWRLTAEAEGFWAAPKSFRVTQSTSGVNVALWPASHLVGQWRVAADEKIPEKFRIRFATVPGSRETERLSHELVCPVTPKGAWSCILPAGFLDLRLRAEGFVSHYLWGAELESGATLDVGRRALERGASVVGWVRSQYPWKPARCELTLQPYVGDIPNRTAQERNQRQAVRVMPNERGFFSLEGVLPGEYILKAEHPGMAVATLAPVTVLENSETEIQELRLQVPARLALTLEPPVDPFLEPWRVQLSRRSPVPGHFDTVAQGESDEGAWQRGGLDPGLYALTVLDSRGSTWWADELEIESGELFFPVALPFMRVHGHVRLGDELVVGAQLQIMGTESAVRFHNWTREDGRFYVFLPREERWNVELQATDPPLHAFVADLEVTPRRGQRPAEMNIELPATRIEGEVVDENGARLPGANVVLSPRQPGGQKVFASLPRRQSTDEAGAFEFHGLQPGEWLATAKIRTTTKTAVSEAVEISIQEGVDTPWLRLQVRPMQTLQGQVISPEGLAVPGARVYTMLPSLQWLAHSPSAVTGLGGEFEMQLPERAERVVLMVLPPGLTARLVQASLPLREPILVEVAREGGRLELDLADPRDLLFSNTGEGQGWGAWPLMLVRAWAEIRGQWLQDTEFIRALGMPPGDYTLCPASLPVESLWLGPPVDEEHCVTGSLAPYGDLRLRTPRSENSDEEESDSVLD